MEEESELSRLAREMNEHLKRQTSVQQQIYEFLRNLLPQELYDQLKKKMDGHE